MIRVVREIHEPDYIGRLRLISSETIAEFATMPDAYAWAEEHGLPRWVECGGDLMTSGILDGQSVYLTLQG